MPRALLHEEGMAMDHSSGHGSMNMYFNNANFVNLWLAAFAVDTKGEYAAAIIGLILLSIVHESLLALRSHLNQAYYPCGVELGAKKPIPKGCEGCCTGEQPPKRYYDYYASRFTQFVHTTADYKRLVISLVYGVNVFLSYLLMLAVMTMNVGFFFSIVGGLTLGHCIFFRKPMKAELPLLAKQAGDDGCGCGC